MKRKRFISDSLKAGSILPALGASLVVPALAAEPSGSNSTTDEIVIGKFAEE
jgi:hypothetical protein